MSELKSVAKAIYALVPAAGSGSRMKGHVRKQFLEIDAVPVIARTLLTLNSHPAIQGIVVATQADDIGKLTSICKTYKIEKCISITAGGKDRQDSVRKGLEELSRLVTDPGLTTVLIHDGARCFLTEAVINRVVNRLKTTDALTAAVRMKDTVALSKTCLSSAQNISEGTQESVHHVPDRKNYWQIQTPQAFCLSDIVNWHRALAGGVVRYTDDCSVALAFGVEVAIVEGSYDNIKITTAEDVELAEFLSKKKEKTIPE